VSPNPGAGDLRWDIIELCSSPIGTSSAMPTRTGGFGFGRAHHRVLHFVHRYPGLKVADLLDVLRITKQSLGRVLKQLLDEGYIVQKAGNNDRRQRLLFATAKGEALVAKLAGLQTDRLNRALRDIEPAGAEPVRQFLRAMIDHDDPDKVLEAIFGRPAPQRQRNKSWPRLQPSHERRRDRPTTPRICCWSTTTAASAICCRAFCAAKATASPRR
jgi:DNA-binding MarR family transcriptional regulator